MHNKGENKKKKNSKNLPVYLPAGRERGKKKGYVIIKVRIATKGTAGRW